MIHLTIIVLLRTQLVWPKGDIIRRRGNRVHAEVYHWFHIF